MSRMFNGISTAVLTALLLPAAAQERNAETELEEIMVTATRRETSLQTTPLAITAVQAEDLAERSITSTAELGAIIPNAAFRPAQGAYGKGVTAFIRGIGQGDTNLNAEPGVAYYIDDVYYPLLFGSNFDLLDLERVEVLRGPQGTLFGRNALAGAISLVSKAPDPTRLETHAQLTTGSFSRMELRGGINLPLGDNVALRLSAVSKKRRGYQQRLDFRCEMVRRGTPELAGDFPYAEGLLIDTDNFTPDSCVIGHLGGEDVHAARGQLLWNASSRLTLTFGGDWLQDESDSAADALIDVNPALAASHLNTVAAAGSFSPDVGPAFAYDQRFLTGNPYQTYATYGDPVPAGANLPVASGAQFYNGSVLRGGLRYRPYAPVKNWGLSARGVYSLTDDMDLTTVVGYRKVDTVFSFDVDGSPLALENTRNNSGEDFWSGEARVTGRHGDFDWVAGVFFFEGDGYVRTRLVSPFNASQRYQTHTYDPQSSAAFLNLGWRPLEKLGFSFGGRYSDDKNVVHYSNLLDGGTAAQHIIFDVTPQDERFDWKAGIDYRLGSQTMVYASAATGFRLPTFNARPFQPSQVTQIEGEDILTYELGVKTDLLEDRLRLNATAFFTDYRTRPAGIGGQEYQLDGNGNPLSGTQVTEPLPNGPPGSTRCRNRTQQEIDGAVPGFTCLSRTYYYNNPGRVRGVEAEFQAHPVNRLALNGSVGFSTFDSRDVNSRAVNRRALGVPEWNASLGAQYVLAAPALDGSITPRLDWLYTGSIAYQDNATTLNQPDYAVLNLRVGYENDAGDLEVAVGVTNLTDKFYYRNIFNLQPFGFPQINGQPSPPREWFLTIRKDL